MRLGGRCGAGRGAEVSRDGEPAGAIARPAPGRIQRGVTVAELDEVIEWLTGFGTASLRHRMEARSRFECSSLQRRSTRRRR